MPDHRSTTRDPTGEDIDRAWRVWLPSSLAVTVLAFALILCHAVLRYRSRDAHWGAASGTRIDLDGPGMPASDLGRVPRPPQRPSLRLGVVPTVSSGKPLAGYHALADYLAEATNREARLVLSDTYGELSDLVRYRECDLAVVCPATLVQGERDFGLQALAVPVVPGTTTDRCTVIVADASAARSLADLRGKRFASAAVGATAGWLFPAYWLKTRGIQPDRFFSRREFTDGHDRAVLAVASGHADAAAVPGAVYDRMLSEGSPARGTTRILLQSPPCRPAPLVVPPQLEGRLRSRLAQALLHMHEEEGGRRVLDALGVERFTAPPPGAYADVRRMIDRVWRATP